MTTGNEAYLTLMIDKNYPDFHSFYAANKKSIYLSIIETFEALSTHNLPSLDMRVSAVVDGMKWTTDFTFRKNDAIQLTRDILPFFEENEEYEVCSYIIKLYDLLSSNVEESCLS